MWHDELWILSSILSFVQVDYSLKISLLGRHLLIKIDIKALQFLPWLNIKIYDITNPRKYQRMALLTDAFPNWCCCIMLRKASLIPIRINT